MALETEEPHTGKQGRVLLKERTQSPGRYLLSPNDDGFERRQARLARAAATQRRRSLAFTDSLEEPEQVEKSKEDVLNPAQVQDLLNSCIKLSAENKINQQNTWDLKLIDYLPDIIKAENEEDSTNFQKVSCTLEASAKIYSCRVDSVHSETYKVLGGLNRSAAPEKEKTSESPEDGDPRTEDTRKKEHQKKDTSTLESYESLNAKHFEAGVNVDPLFHQMSAQFDEGGAKGLLLNTLSVYRGCEILFDSSDVPEKYMKLSLPNEPSAIDLSFIKDSIDDMLDCTETEISVSLREVINLLDDPARKAAEADMSHDEEEPASSWFDNAEDADDSMGEVDNPPTEPADNCLEGEDLVADDYGQDESEGFTELSGPPSVSPAHDFDEMNNMGDENMSGVQTSDQALLADKALEWIQEGLGICTGKNAWAGPEHWKFMKSRVSSLPEDSETVVHTKRKKKDPFTLSYTSIPEIDMSLLAKPRDLRADLLPNARQPVCTTLPEDMRFKADDLLRLFLRPLVMCIRGRRRRAGFATSDAAFSATDMEGDDGDDNFVGDADYFGSGDVENNVIPEPRKIQKIEISYDRTSKQVDVRALKSSMWDIVKEDQEEEIHFSEVFSKVPETASAGAPEDISVHLCFICLLHLANEHNLVIQGCPEMDELLIRNVQPE